MVQGRNIEKSSTAKEPNLAEKVTSQIRDWILNGTYQPGEKLPPERRLASLLGVNRGSLRLALKKLEQFGLLQSRQGDGTRVRDLSHAAGIELLPFLFQTALVRQPEMLRDILELRVLFCTHLVRLAAHRGGPSDLRRISELIDQMEEATGPETLISLEFDMYWEYARAGNSLVCQLLLNTVRGPFEQHREPFACMAEDPAEVITAAKGILDAVSRKSEAEAVQRAEIALRSGAERALERAGVTASPVF